MFVYLCVKFATVCLLSRYMHILPFEILEKNLIVLGPIIFPIAHAYSLIVMPSVDCRIMAWSWESILVLLRLRMSLQVLWSFQFFVELSFLLCYDGMHPLSHTTQTHCARKSELWARTAVLGSA